MPGPKFYVTAPYLEGKGTAFWSVFTDGIGYDSRALIESVRGQAGIR
jgi:hypothetical protein